MKPKYIKSVLLGGKVELPARFGSTITQLTEGELRYLSAYLAFDGCVAYSPSRGCPKFRLGCRVSSLDSAVFVSKSLGANIYPYTTVDKSPRVECYVGQWENNRIALETLIPHSSRKKPLYEKALSWSAGQQNYSSYSKEFRAIRDGCRGRPHSISCWYGMAGLVDSIASISYSDHNPRGSFNMCSNEHGTLHGMVDFLQKNTHHHVDLFVKKAAHFLVRSHSSRLFT